METPNGPTTHTQPNQGKQENKISTNNARKATSRTKTTKKTLKTSTPSQKKEIIKNAKERILGKTLLAQTKQKETSNGKIND